MRSGARPGSNLQNEQTSVSSLLAKEMSEFVPITLKIGVLWTARKTNLFRPVQQTLPKTSDASKL